jgi:hypothetical protein
VNVEIEVEVEVEIEIAYRQYAITSLLSFSCL